MLVATYSSLPMDALVEVPKWPVKTAAAGWITDHGWRSTIGPVDHPFALASVTKALVAYAVLVAVEEGTLAFDQPAGPPGSTIRHLLAHASGLADDSARPLTWAGKRRIYSNSGFEVLGAALADASDMPAADYLREAVAEPLGLSATVLDGSPAHGAVGSVSDLLVVAAEWLRPTLVSAETMAEATTVQFPDLIGVLPGYGRQAPNPWGLGFEIKGGKSPHWTGATNAPETFGHFGGAGTFIWVDPVHRVGCVALADERFGPWAIERWPALSDAVVAAAAS